MVKCKHSTTKYITGQLTLPKPNRILSYAYA